MSYCYLSNDCFEVFKAKKITVKAEILCHEHITSLPQIMKYKI